MNSLFLTLTRLSIKASIVFVTILLLQKLFNNRLSPKIKYFMWFLIIITLTFPVTIERNISINNLPGFFQNKQVVEINNKINNFTDSLTESTIIFNPKITSNDNLSNTDVSEENSLIKSFFTLEFALKIASLIWLLGILIFSAIYILQLKKLKSIVKSQEELNNESIINVLNESKKALNISRDIKLYKTDKFSSPALTGIYNIKILIPEYILADVSNRDLKFIIYHELAHLKKLDNITNYLILVYKTIYWFNPFIHLMFKCMKKDMEVSCDNVVLDYLDKEDHINYGRTILNIVEKMSFVRQNPIATCLIEEKDEIKRRIIMIKRYKSYSKKLSIFALVISVLVGCSAISEPSDKEGTTPKEESNITIENNDQNQGLITLEKAQSIIENKDNLFFLDQVEKSLNLARPYVYTYYLDQAVLESEEPTEIMVIEMIYPIKSDEESSALKIYSQYHEIIEMKIDEFNGMPSNSYKDTTYIVNDYSGERLIPYNEDFEFNEFMDTYIGQDLYTFNAKFDLSHANIEAFVKDSNLQVNFYLLGEESSSVNEPSKGLYILSKDNEITEMKMGDSLFNMNDLNSLFDTKFY